MIILRRGKPVVRLVPVDTEIIVDWSRSAALALAPKPVRDQKRLRQALRDSKGRY